MSVKIDIHALLLGWRTLAFKCIHEAVNETSDHDLITFLTPTRASIDVYACPILTWGKRRDIDTLLGSPPPHKPLGPRRGLRVFLCIGTAAELPCQLQPGTEILYVCAVAVRGSCGTERRAACLLGSPNSGCVSATGPWRS
jgi:hypothetical protein